MPRPKIWADGNQPFVADSYVPNEDGDDFNVNDGSAAGADGHQCPLSGTLAAKSRIKGRESARKGSLAAPALQESDEPF